MFFPACYNNAMKSLRSILALILIAAVSLSIIGCAHTAYGMHMHGRDMLPTHIDHALSLTTAVIPAVMILALALAVMAASLCSFVIRSVPEAHVHSQILIDDEAPPAERLKYALRSLRSPPAR